jgi:hypothetical protein
LLSLEWHFLHYTGHGSRRICKRATCAPRARLVSVSSPNSPLECADSLRRTHSSGLFRSCSSLSESSSHSNVPHFSWLPRNIVRRWEELRNSDKSARAASRSAPARSRLPFATAKSSRVRRISLTIAGTKFTPYSRKFCSQIIHLLGLAPCDRLQAVRLCDEVVHLHSQPVPLPTQCVTIIFDSPQTILGCLGCLVSLVCLGIGSRRMGLPASQVHTGGNINTGRASAMAPSARTTASAPCVREGLLGCSASPPILSLPQPM